MTDRAASVAQTGSSRGETIVGSQLQDAFAPVELFLTCVLTDTLNSPAATKTEGIAFHYADLIPIGYVVDEVVIDYIATSTAQLALGLTDSGTANGAEIMTDAAVTAASARTIYKLPIKQSTGNLVSTAAGTLYIQMSVEEMTIYKMIVTLKKLVF